ncbi:hypothetical protein [Legionella jordanis]|uniref:Uncharacterized protein n=1 Tax=Legionella jordanis TaxID=456 RepID=A0A0W0VAV9_9GAMM|nr:hypothetical protein [Legionella jordanis]KTD17266.1 hypothetical protein Ljor_1572 [Legionella jordanis]VEH12537.1 Uncharacterised protein [Legionella jordanis]
MLWSCYYKEDLKRQGYVAVAGLILLMMSSLPLSRLPPETCLSSFGEIVALLAL